MMITLGLITLALLLIGIVATKYLNYSDGWQMPLQMIGFIGGGGILFFFFLIIATTSIDDEKTTYTEIKPVSITKSRITVLVEFDNFKTEIYETKKEYDDIDSTTIFLQTIEYNYYGILLNDRKIKYKYKKE